MKQGSTGMGKLEDNTVVAGVGKGDVGSCPGEGSALGAVTKDGVGALVGVWGGGNSEITRASPAIAHGKHHANAMLACLQLPRKTDL